MEVKLNKKVHIEPVGELIKLKDGVGYGRGLRGVKAGEIVYISSQRSKRTTAAPLFVKGLVLNLNVNEFSVIVFNNESTIQAGDRIFRSNRLLEIPVSLTLFGQVIGALAELKTEYARELMQTRRLTVREKSSVVEVKAAGIVDRVSINIPLCTGLKAVDSLIPIGRGQRELIIGDRQTGKTSIAIDVILNHTAENNRLRECFTTVRLAELRKIMWFVYAAIGQKQSSVSTIFNLLKRKKAEWYTCIVAATAAESAPLQFLVPYTACTVGEYIRDFVGGHSTVVYDDLSKHAVAYRQMSLLLRRPPGREAFPGDVFYLHSRLLERAGALRNLRIDNQVRVLSSFDRASFKWAKFKTLSLRRLIKTFAIWRQNRLARLTRRVGKKKILERFVAKLKAKRQAAPKAVNFFEKVKRAFKGILKKKNRPTASKKRRTRNRSYTAGLNLNFRSIRFPSVSIYNRGTLTAFPVIETQSGDVSAYIPTNVISITDGQIFLETELFYKGVRPAINIGLSVSRVGSAAQPALMKKVSGSLKMELAQYREVESFASLGAALDPFTLKLLIRGENLIEILKQNVNAPLTTMREVLSIFLGLGFSASWLTQILTNLKLSYGGLITAERFNSSWFELFSTFSVAFKSAHVSTFIRSFLNFFEQLGLTKVFDLPYVERLNSVILSLFPNYFFDDLTLTYLFEASATDVEQFKGAGESKEQYNAVVLTTLCIFNSLTKREGQFNEQRIAPFNKVPGSFLALPALVTKLVSVEGGVKRLNGLQRFFPQLSGVAEYCATRLNGRIPSILQSFLTLATSFVGGGANKTSSFKGVVASYVIVANLLFESTLFRDEGLNERLQTQLLNQFYQNWVLSGERSNTKSVAAFKLQQSLITGQTLVNGTNRGAMNELTSSFPVINPFVSSLKRYRKRSFRSIKRNIKALRRARVRLLSLSISVLPLFVGGVWVGAFNKQLVNLVGLIQLNLYKVKTISFVSTNPIENTHQSRLISRLFVFIFLTFKFSTELWRSGVTGRFIHGLFEIFRFALTSRRKGRKFSQFRRLVQRWFVGEQRFILNAKGGKWSRVSKAVGVIGLLRSIKALFCESALTQINRNRVALLKLSRSQYVSLEKAFATSQRRSKKGGIAPVRKK